MMIDLEIGPTQPTSAINATNKVTLQKNVLTLLKEMARTLVINATRKVILPRIAQTLMLDLRTIMAQELATNVKEKVTWLKIVLTLLSKDLVEHKAALTVDRLVICLESAPNQEMRQEVQEVEAEVRDKATMTLADQELKVLQVLKSATDVTRQVTLLENVQMPPKVVMTELAKATRDSVVMMVALLTEKVLKTMVVVLKVAGEAATTQDKVGTTT